MPSLQFWPLPRAPGRTRWEERTAVSTSMPPFLPTAWVMSTGAPHFLDADREAQGGHAAAEVPAGRGGSARRTRSLRGSAVAGSLCPPLDWAA